MTLAIRQLESLQPLTDEAIESFMEENTFPIQEGTTSTFVFRGEAERVNLRHFISGLPTSRPFTRIDGTDLWYLALELPRGSRVEYKIDVVRNGRHRWIRDPLNVLLARDPFGSNSVCHSLGYETPDWTRFDAAARPGEIVDHEVESVAFGERRGVQIYLPPRYRERRKYPLLVVHDGSDFLRFAALKTVLDNLIYRQEIAPMLVALIDSNDRLVEYADDERHARFVVDELVPDLERTYPLIARPGARGLMGASFGAVAALSAVWRRPGVVGRLLLQSGSFAFTDIGSNQRGPAFEPVVEFVNAFRDAPGRPTRKVYVSCGRYESLIYENRSLVPILQATGMDVRYTEARDGHNWENWRDRLREGISYLFPGPLWMVYE